MKQRVPYTSIPTWLLMLIALVNGLIYVFIIPPWEQNDEPGQFEYTWLIARLGRVPQIEEIDQSLRREVAASMEEHGFFERRHGRANLFVFEESVHIGPEQLGGLPFYYQIVSYPLRLVKFLDVTFQMYYLRLISLIFFVFTVYVVSRISTEVFADPFMATFVPLLVALLPGFVHKMTAINDDVAAVFFYTLFLWMAIRLLRNGVDARSIVALVFSILACWLTKRTVWSALPLGILAILLSFFRRQPRLGWLGVGLFLLILSPILFAWDQFSPAYVYYLKNAHPAFSVEDMQAVAGSKVLKITPDTGEIYFSYHKQKFATYNGQTMTLGAWAWSDGSVSVRVPEVWVNGKLVSNLTEVVLNHLPELYYASFSVPNEVGTSSIPFNPRLPKGSSLYLDCIFLIQGEIDDTDRIEPHDSECSAINLNGIVYENMIKNASMEHRWPVLNPEFGKWADGAFSTSIAYILAAFDLDTGFPYVRVTANHLFATFWERFGWGDAPLVGNFARPLFLVVTFLALGGNLIYLIKRKFRVDWNLVLFFSLTAISTIFMALFRASTNWIHYVFTPVARYYFPAIFPMAVFLATGWHTISKEIIGTISKADTNQNKETLIYALLLILYNGWSWFSIYFYYDVNH